MVGIVVNWDAQAGPGPPRRPRKDEIGMLKNFIKCHFIVSMMYLSLILRSLMKKYLAPISSFLRRLVGFEKIPNISNLTTIESILKGIQFFGMSS